MPARLSSRVLVGRGREIAALAASLDGLAAGQGGTLLLSGPAGIGKSRLVAELEALGAARGASVLVGACPPLHEEAVAYAPLAELFRRLLDGLPAPDVVRVTGAAAGELAVLIPGLAAADGRTGDGSRLAPAVLGVLEDAHWIDASTAALVARAAQWLRSAPVLLVVTYRAEEQRAALPLGELLGALARDPSPQRLELGLLTPAQVAEQLAAIRGADPDPAFVRSLAARAEGNPLWVEELLAAGDAHGVPQTLRDAVLLRLDELPDPSQRLLRLAAVAGRRVLFDLLAAALDEDEGDP